MLFEQLFDFLMNRTLGQVLFIQNVALVDHHRKRNCLFEQLNHQIFPQRAKNIQSIDHKQEMSPILIRFVPFENFFEHILPVEIEPALIDFLIVFFRQVIVVLEAVTPVTQKFLSNLF
jgi:hypothetical protein